MIGWSLVGRRVILWVKGGGACSRSELLGSEVDDVDVPGDSHRGNPMSCAISVGPGPLKECGHPPIDIQ